MYTFKTVIKLYYITIFFFKFSLTILAQLLRISTVDWNYFDHMVLVLDYLIVDEHLNIFLFCCVVIIC